MNEQLLTACVDLFGHTGAKGCQVRYSDDEEPTVWFVVADYGEGRWETAAALTADVAAWRLAERLIDGGHCMHCGRPTALLNDEGPLAWAGLGCEYRYRNGKIVRGCDSMPVGSPASPFVKGRRS